MRETRELLAPYPGLRPFEAHDLPVFFGRETHVSRLIELLAKERFLAVVGPSGAGKSSLVRAGLLPALALGWQGDVSDWRIARLRPGERPLLRLAQALLQPDVLGRQLGNTAVDGGTPQDLGLLALIEAELRRGPRALVDLMDDALRRTPERPPFNLLILVDQFEELFRYADLGARQGNEAEAFINLLLQPRRDAAAAALRIHVVLTMRTDALHQCARFLELPEAINRAQYLVPRLRPDELQRAIEMPARIFEGQVDIEVVQAVAGRAQQANDELPQLQHALARMWQRASARNARHPRITLDDLRDAGGVDDALSRHANSIFDGLTPVQQVLADSLFRAITEHPQAGLADSRRPQRLGQIAAAADLHEGDWRTFVPVLDAFSDEGANFLHFAQPLGPQTVVDVSHEALIRQWDRLRALAEWEASLAADYRRWRDRSDHHAKSKGELLTGADLLAASAWLRGAEISNPGIGRLPDGSSVQRPHRPHVGWSCRYAQSRGRAEAEFDALVRFIDGSEKAEAARLAEEERLLAEQQQAREREARMLLEAESNRVVAAEREQRIAARGRQRARRWLFVAVIVALIAGMAAFFALAMQRQAMMATSRAEDALMGATVLRLVAEGQAMVANARSGDTRRGLLQILAAHRMRPGVEPDSALQASWGQTLMMRRIWPAPASLSLAFSHDGARIVTGGSDNTLRLWDAGTGGAIGPPLRGHSDEVRGVAFSPDDTRLVSASKDGTLRLWNARTGKAIGEPWTGHSESVNGVAFSPDGSRVVSASDDKTLLVWDSQTGAVIGEPLRGHAYSVKAVAFSPDGLRIVSGGEDRTLHLWDAKTGASIGEPLRGHADGVASVAFSPDGARIVSGSLDHSVRLWDARTGAAIGEPLRGHFDSVHSVAFSPDGLRIASGSEDNTLRVWDARTGAAIGETLRWQSDAVTAVAFSRDGTRILSGSRHATLRLWDAETGDAISSSMVGHSAWISGVAFSPDGLTVVSSSGDNSLRLWNARTGEAVGEPLRGHTAPPNCVAYSPNRQIIVSGAGDATLRLWDARTGAAIGEPMVGHSASVISVAFSPDGARIVSAGEDNTLRLWDAQTGTAIGEPMIGHTDRVTGVAFNADGSRIVSGSDDKTLRVWDAKNGTTIGKPLRGQAYSVKAVAFSRDGLRIVSGGVDNALRLWDVGTGDPIGEPLRGHSDWVLSVAFSPDGSRIVSGSMDHTLRLWHARTGAAIGEPLRAHSKGVSSVAFSPDGSHVVSGGWDNTLRMWPVFEAWATDLCAKLTSNMTAQEWKQWVGDLPYRRQCPDLPGPADEGAPNSR